MKQIVLQLEQFGPVCGGNIRWSEMLIKGLLDWVVFANAIMLRCNPHILPMYEYARRGKIKYIRQPNGPGVEKFVGIPTILHQGGGDCDQLCCWRVAELRVRGSPDYPTGEQANLKLIKYDRPGKPLLYHVVIERAPTRQFPQGWIEDPSRRLGMKGAA